MRLSELSTDRAADVLCEIAPYAVCITGDKALLDALEKKFDVKGRSVAELYTFAAEKYGQIVPLLLRDHRQDVFGILAALNGTEAESIGQQNVMETMRQVKEIFSDKELLDFFASLRRGTE